MDDTPTTPLPPAQEPQPAHTEQQPLAREPFYKRYGLAFAISTLVLGSFVVLSFVGVGAFAVGSFISHARVGSSHVFEQGTIPAEPGVPGKDGSGSGSGEGSNQGQGTVPGPDTNSQLTMVRGTITSISGSTWTIGTQRGASLTVLVTSNTVFGTPNQSESASDFAVGQEVIVLGSRSGATLTAVRVLDLVGFKVPGQSTPGTPSTPTPTK